MARLLWRQGTWGYGLALLQQLSSSEGETRIQQHQEPGRMSHLILALLLKEISPRTELKRGVGMSSGAAEEGNKSEAEVQFSKMALRDFSVSTIFLESLPRGSKTGNHRVRR